MLQQEAEFFSSLAPKIIAYVSKELKNVAIVKQKSDNLNDINFVTQIDVTVEQMITSAIKELFPNDQILAEEEYADTHIPEKGRIWIIDPICGTGNLARQILLFVTNIALADNGTLIAACAIDHQQKTFYYSTGDSKIFEGNNLVDTSKKVTGTVIEVDMFAAHTRNEPTLKQAYSKFIANLYTQTAYALVTYNSSLSFTYAAIGKLDGYVSPHHNPWDVAAPNFLMLQAGGIVTEIQGNPWHLTSGTVLATKEKEIHQKLLEIYLKNK